MLESIQTQKRAYNNQTTKMKWMAKTSLAATRLYAKIRDHFRHRMTLIELQSKSDETLKDIGLDRSWLDQNFKTRTQKKFDDLGW